MVPVLNPRRTLPVFSQIYLTTITVLFETLTVEEAEHLNGDTFQGVYRCITFGGI